MPTRKTPHDKIAILKRSAKRLARSDFEDNKVFPYLDSKGIPTIGIGHNIPANAGDNKQSIPDYLKSLGVIHDITKQPLSREDIQKEYFKLEKEREKNQNTKAKAYEKTTNIRLPESQMFRIAENDLSYRLSSMIKEIGEENSRKLSEDQMVALLDIYFNRGSFTSFPKLKEAIARGDTNAIAKESMLYTNAKEYKRNWARLYANYALIKNITVEQAQKELRDIYERDVYLQQVKKMKEKSSSLDSEKRTPCQSPVSVSGYARRDGITVANYERRCPLQG